MSRPIKFRAWDKDENVIRDWGNLLTHRYAKKGDSIFNDGDYDIEQFTGLHDSQGKEIYENDVVNRCFADGVIVGVVKWCEYRAGFLHVPVDEKLYGNGDSMTNISSFDVIGNIHTTPELLKNESEGL